MCPTARRKTTEATYFVKLKDKTVAPLMELTEDGIVKSINVPYSQTENNRKTTQKPAVSKQVNPRDFLTEEILMASSTAKMAELVAKEIYQIRESKNALLRGQAVSKQVNPRDFLTEEILMASSTAKMAELVAKEIYQIRESKNALLRGQADNTPSDGAQLKIMIDNLNQQEDAMTKMFSGSNVLRLT